MKATKGLTGWTIARIRGVGLKIHVSLIFVLFYVAVVSSLQFPFILKDSGINPADIGGNPGLWGVLFAVSLFVSVTIHEFAHVLVAQSMGVKVTGITLMMLGGVSEMERIPEKKYAEFKVAIVGPLTSLALAVLLNWIYNHSQSAPLALFGYWMARVNLLLAIFNTLPAFPLDGGRAMRSLFAARVGFVRATEISVKVARGMAWVLGAIGLLSFSFLLVLIALFIYSSATLEGMISFQRSSVADLRAGEVGIRTPILSETESLSDAAEGMIASRTRCLPIRTGDGSPALLWLEDLRRVPRAQWRETSISQILTQAPHTLRSSEKIEPFFQDLAAQGALPWANDQNELLGIVSYPELAAWIELRKAA